VKAEQVENLSALTLRFSCVTEVAFARNYYKNLQTFAARPYQVKIDSFLINPLNQVRRRLTGKTFTRRDKSQVAETRQLAVPFDSNQDKCKGKVKVTPRHAMHRGGYRCSSTPS
jgi:hypothetical protein